MWSFFRQGHCNLGLNIRKGFSSSKCGVIELPNLFTMFYAVRKGRKTGIFKTWEECKANVTGFHQAQYAKFKCEQQAWHFMSTKLSKSQVLADYPDTPSKKTSESNARSAVQQSHHLNISTSTNTNTNTSIRTKSSINKNSSTSTVIPSSIVARSKRYRTVDECLDANTPRKKSKPISSIGSGGSQLPDGQNTNTHLACSAVKARVTGFTERLDAAERKKMLIAYTDGAAPFNGNGQNVPAGIGVFWGDNDPRNRSLPLAGPVQTNNRAELTACIVAVETVLEDDRDLILLTDSQYVLKGMTVWLPNWLKRSWNQVKNADLFQRLIHVCIEKKGQVYMEYVKGHSTSYGNNMADQLAVAAAEKAALGKTAVEKAGVVDLASHDLNKPQSKEEMAS